MIYTKQIKVTTVRCLVFLLCVLNFQGWSLIPDSFYPATLLCFLQFLHEKLWQSFKFCHKCLFEENKYRNTDQEKKTFGGKSPTAVCSFKQCISAEIFHYQFCVPFSELSKCCFLPSLAEPQECQVYLSLPIHYATRVALHTGTVLG